MQNDIKAKLVRRLGDLMIAIYVALLVISILIDDWPISNDLPTLGTLTVCSLVILAALEHKYSGTPRKQSDPKQYILAGALGVLIIVVAILLKDVLDTIP